MLHSVVGEHIAEALKACAMSCPDGCFVEVGVYKGGTAQHLLDAAKVQGREFYAYDTFMGIPYKAQIDSHVVGDFSDTNFGQVCQDLPGANVIQGVFPNSAVSMPLVAFAHLDCDQYQSVRDSAQYLDPRMAFGGIMWFDDYGCLEGATLAVDELYPGRVQFYADSGKAYVKF